MKKIALTFALLICVTSAFGQRKAVNQASRDVLVEKPDFKALRNTMKEALVHEESMNDAKTWYVAGEIERTYFEQQNMLKQIGKEAKDKDMYNALIKSYEYYNRALALDTLPNEKGKVKPKYTKKIVAAVKKNIDGFSNGGLYFYNNQEYKKAYKIWKIFCEIPSVPVFTEKGREGLPADSVVEQVEFYGALAALQTGDHKLAIKAFKAARKNTYEKNNIYKYLVNEYEILQDTAQIIKTLNEAEKECQDILVEEKQADGSVIMKKENIYTLKLINIFINRGEYDKAIAKLDEVLASDPENIDYLNVKGGLYENQKNDDLAIECYQKAVDLNPENPSSLSNLGRMYFNQAIEKNEEISSEKSNSVYEKRRAEEVLPLFKKALPYYEKAHKISPDEREYMIALRGIYYNLNMPKEQKAIETEMGY